MSPTLNGISALQCFKRSNAVEIRNRIMFNFYLRLPHIQETGWPFIIMFLSSFNTFSLKWLVTIAHGLFLSIQHYSASNAVMQLKYAMEQCSNSTQDCHIIQETGWPFIIMFLYVFFSYIAIHWTIQLEVACYNCTLPVPQYSTSLA